MAATILFEQGIFVFPDKPNEVFTGKNLTRLSEKLQLNSIVCYFTTKNTKITKKRRG